MSDLYEPKNNIKRNHCFESYSSRRSLEVENQSLNPDPANLIYEEALDLKFVSHILNSR